MCPLLLQIKESTANCPKEAALSTLWELDPAAGDPPAELPELRKHSVLSQTNQSSRLYGFLTDF